MNYFFINEKFIKFVLVNAVTDIQLFNALKKKLGEKEAENLVSFLRSAVDEKLEEQIPHLATKEDLISVESTLRQEIAQSKVDMVKWFVAFFVTLTLLIVGLYFK